MLSQLKLERRDFMKGAFSLGALAGIEPFLFSRQMFGLNATTTEEIPYGVGNWSIDPFDPLGNHRALVRVAEASDTVRVRIPWRRRDNDPEKKEIILVDAASKVEIKNFVRVDINREFGDLVFQPSSGPGDYLFYYLPNQGPGRSGNYPTVIYPPPTAVADPQWIERNRLTNLIAQNYRKLPQAQVIAFQAVADFDSFYPMEVIATAAETQRLVDQNSRAGLLLFPEDRSRSIRMFKDLPRRWITQGAGTAFRGDVDRDEYYVMQIGAYAARGNAANLKVNYGDLRGQSGAIIPRSAWTCFNEGGVDWSGHSFKNDISVAEGHIQPLWLGVQIPEDAPAGEYKGTVTVSADGGTPSPIDVSLTVTGQTIADHGDNDPYRLSRLRWLNSRLAEDDSLVPPFTPVTLSGNTVNILGRSVTIGLNGLPERIRSYYASGNTHITEEGRDILAGPLSLVIETEEGVVRWKPRNLQFESHPPGRVSWSVTDNSGPFTMLIQAQMEFDGDVEFTLALSSTEKIDIKDIRLEVPYSRDVAVYMMGLGQKGGFRPNSFHWVWDVTKNQDSVWVGDVNAGMQVALRDNHYSRPLNTNFYNLKPLVMPESWANNGHGGCSLADQGESTTLLKCYSGSRTMSPGETLHYNFRLLLTPFKPIDTRAHWTNRYYHNGAPPPTEVKASGANVINIHHATSINPYLNYPFLRAEEMKTYIDEAHQLGMKVKIYYTVRELSDHAPEMFALRSLGHEVFVPGSGGGYSWLQEHLDSDYLAGWCVPTLHDATIINSGASRWHNYYVEGINWLAKHVGIDGIYLDDLAFDRLTMQRVRRALDSNRPGALIDLHSANQYDQRDGFASSANLYMEQLPYINRLWFGEYFDYNSLPDYYLIEISGIPFGLMGEMLQGGGNPWRGMVYGMTARLGHSGDPRALWKFWDEFGIENSRMEGYWVPSNPVKTGKKDVLATSYIKEGAVLVAIASWAAATENIRVAVDWKALGIDPAKAVLTAPTIENFQEAATYKIDDEIPILPGRGLLLML
jgi:hypothetical protein